MIPRPLRSTRTDPLFPYTTRFLSQLQPLARHAAQQVGLALAGAVAETRQDRLAFFRLDRAASCDHQRVVDRLRQVGEQHAHLFRRLEAVVRRHPAAVLLAHVSAFGNARSEEHTSELQSLMRTPYPVFCSQTNTNPAPHPTLH